jgi:hypothetical protein
MAILEDGLTLKALQTINAQKENTRRVSGELGIPVNNLFGLFNLNFGMKGEHKNNRLFGQNTTFEKTYTTASLFNKLRNHLLESGLIREITITEDSLEEFMPGDFIEAEIMLTKNPIIETFQTMNRLIKLYKEFSDAVTIKANQGGGKKQKYIKSDNDLEKIMPMIDTILNDVQSNGYIDLIGITDSSIRFVLSTIKNCFINSDSDEILDGKYRVLGKIVKVVKDSDKINLLRKTSFNAMQEQIIDQLCTTLASTQENGLLLPKLDRVIASPALLVKPIAIYI